MFDAGNTGKVRPRKVPPAYAFRKRRADAPFSLMLSADPMSVGAQMVAQRNLSDGIALQPQRGRDSKAQGALALGRRTQNRLSPEGARFPRWIAHSRISPSWDFKKLGDAFPGAGYPRSMDPLSFSPFLARSTNLARLRL